MKKVLVLFALSVFALCSNATANMIQNGSFEIPDITDDNLNGTHWSLYDIIDGWENLTTNSAKLELQENGLYGGGFVAADGDQWIELAASQPTAIGQTISTTIGKTYTLDFAFAARPGEALMYNVLNVWITDNLLNETIVASTSGWNYFSFSFVANLAETFIGFADVHNGGRSTYGTFVDDVSVAPVPEPGTLLLLGSGLAGLAFYRRKKTTK